MAEIAVLEQLSWRRDRQTILDRIDLQVSPGEILGVIGPNGAGKSSLLLMLAGLLTPSGGWVHVEGQPAATVALSRSGTVGLITASPGLYPLLTGRENLRFFGALYGLSAEQTAARVAPLLDALGMTAHLDRAMSACSSGMQQKISLARALLMRPRLLLLDEPTSNLDPVSAETLLSTIRRQADDGLAVVLVSHDLDAIERHCDRAILLATRIRAMIDIDRAHARRPSPLMTLWQDHLGGA